MLIPVLGIFTFLFLAWCISENRWKVRWRPVVTGMALLMATSAFFFATVPGNEFQNGCTSGISTLITCAETGAKGAFNEKFVSDPQFFSTAMAVLPSLIFIGALTSVLYHLGILQQLIRVFAVVVRRVMGISGTESFIAVANVFLGMVESPFAVRPYLAKLTRSELFCMMTCGMATIAGGVMMAYAHMLQSCGTPPGHLVIASILSVFSAVLISKIVIPETEETAAPATLSGKDTRPDANILDAACRGAGEGITLGIQVIAMIIGFTALIAFLNALFGGFGDVWGAPLTLQRIFGWMFAPAAWLLGIPWSECHFAGQLLGEKTVLNEFLAYQDMTRPENVALLSAKSRIIMTYALCGFANFGSLAIMVGGLSSLIPERRHEMARLALPALVTGTLAAFLTAQFAAIFTF